MSFGSGTFGSGSGAALAPPPFIPPAPPVVLDVWPATLPQYVLQDGYAEPEPDVIRRTEMDEGPAKQRPRCTVGIRPFLMQIEVDLDQVAIFQTFYEDTLKDGTLPFSWKHPRTQVNTNFRFVGGQPQKIKIQDSRNYRIPFSVEVMP